jgi:hypothetical protein
MAHLDALNAFSFSNRIMLFVRLSLIHGEILATRSQSSNAQKWRILLDMHLSITHLI